MISQTALLQGYQVEQRQSVGSTNTLAFDYAEANHPGRLWIVAEEQQSGHGRRGRVWSSPKGNLYATLLLVNEFSAEKAALLSFVAGVSLAETISQLALQYGQHSFPITLKWPNDILLNDAKVSGILLEMKQIAGGKTALVIGIGLNIACYPDDLPYAATSLHASGLMVSVEEVFAKLSENWALNFTLWQQPGGEKAIHSKWLAKAANLGKPMRLIRDDCIYCGVFETLDDEFRCILKEDTGKRIAIGAGEVHFGTVASLRKQQ